MIKPCTVWAILLLISAAMLFIPDKYINTRRRPNNGAVLLVIIACLFGMIAHHQIALLFVVSAAFILMLDKVDMLPSVEIKR